MSALNRYSLGAVMLGAVLVLATAQGCSDDSNANPTPPDVNTGGRSTTGGAGNKAGDTGKGGTGKGGNSTTGATGGVGNGDAGETAAEGGTGASSASGGEGGGTDQPPIPECTLPELGADGCFNCPKDKNVKQWLNRCADGDCEPFANKDRLPLLNADGSRPALPN